MHTSINTKAAVFGLGLCLLLTRNCLANPVMIEDLLFPEELQRFIGIVIVDIAVDCLVIMAGYAVVKRFALLWVSTWFQYLFYVVVFGFLVDGVLLKIDEFARNSPLYFSIKMILLGFVMLAAGNYLFCRVFNNLPPRHSMVVASLMGVFTNPYLFNYVWDYLFEPVWW